MIALKDWRISVRPRSSLSLYKHEIGQSIIARFENEVIIHALERETGIQLVIGKLSISISREGDVLLTHEDDPHG